MNVNKALAVIGDYLADVTVAEYYDEDAELREALGVLFPNFEYPDFSHKTMTQVLREAEGKAKRSAWAIKGRPFNK